MLFKHLIVLLTLVRFYIVVFAQDTNSFLMKPGVYLPLQEIELNFNLTSCSEKLKIRAVSDVGLVEMRKDSSPSWVNSYIDLTTHLFMRVKNVNNKKTTIFFEILNGSTGGVTKTDSISIWLSDAYVTYINRLNNNINTN